MPKHLMLYNFDQARDYPFGVINEGVASSWSVGPMAMSILGRTIHLAQKTMLSYRYREKPLFLMLDGDADVETEEIANELREVCGKGLGVVRLPADKDPGDFLPDVNMGLIYEAAEQQGIVMPTLVS
jgi:hypothetical protein